MFKKLMCLALALAMCFSAAAFAEEDLQAQLDAANARIAELEAEVEKYLPFYEAQIVAEYDGGVIFRADALEEYAYIESMYSNYGISLADYGLEEQYQQMAVDSLVQDAALKLKATELGLDQLDDETLASMAEEAAANFETYITSVSSYFTGDDVSEEETRAQSIEYLNSLGYTEEAILDSLKASYVDEQLYNYVVADVTLTDEDVQAAYDALVAEQEASFSSDSSYNTSRNAGETIVWNPENYRAVKHVLIKFDDDQAARYDELNDTLSSLNDELDALVSAAEESAADADAASDEAAEELSTEIELRTKEEISADIDAVMADLDALYDELMPTAQEVIDKFNGGADFSDLIAEYNEDPGMQSEPTASNGYAVSATSTTWDPAFTEGAMSIANVGEISGPVLGQYGIHIIYYASDIPAGPVALSEVREALEPSFLDQKISDTYTSAVDSWVAALNPIYHYENLAN